jgi:hypothetical protein
MSSEPAAHVEDGAKPGLPPARNAPARSGSCWAPSAVKTRTIVSGCGGVKTPRALRRQPSAARISWPAELTHAVTSSRELHPHSAAAAHIARMLARERRIPRRSRG